VWLHFGNQSLWSSTNKNKIDFLIAWLIPTMNTQWAKSQKKKPVKECIFDNIALYFKCQINKNTLLQTAFFGDFVQWVGLSDLLST